MTRAAVGARDRTEAVGAGPHGFDSLAEPLDGFVEAACNVDFVLDLVARQQIGDDNAESVGCPFTRAEQQAPQLYIVDARITGSEP